MPSKLVNKYPDLVPKDDAHPYRTGAWAPDIEEWDATDLTVHGDLPADLNGVYLRNTENPLLPSIGRYHPFDGDGMLHSLCLSGGQASYRNRMIQTNGLKAELAAGEPLWAGLMESPERSLRDGWGARTRLKDASSTDVVVHNGSAATSFYQCGDIYELDPITLEARGKADWTQDLTPGWGVSAHTKIDEATGELLFFNYSKQAPYMHYGVVDASGKLVHYIPIELPGPRLPHDMAFTENFAILNDFPLYWDPKALQSGAHAVRYFRDQPSRFAIVPRRGQPGDVRWFEAAPTFVLHWINAFEDGDEIVLDGFFEENPSPKIQPDPDDPRSLFRMLDMHVTGARAHRWRFNLKTGTTTESPLDDSVLEFGMINPNIAGKPYKYVWAMTTKPGWFLFNGISRLDVSTGERQTWQFEEGVFASESPMAPKLGSTGEDDGYVLTYTTDMNRNRSQALVFAAEDVSRGPICAIDLPKRICVGTHSCWAAMPTG